MHRQLAEFSKTDREKESDRAIELFERLLRTIDNDILNHNPSLTKEELSNMSNDRRMLLHKEVEKQKSKNLVNYLQEKNIDIGKYRGSTDLDEFDF